MNDHVWVFQLKSEMDIHIGDLIGVALCLLDYISEQQNILWFLLYAYMYFVLDFTAAFINNLHAARIHSKLQSNAIEQLKSNWVQTGYCL